MPLYDYECPDGHEYEEALPLKDYDKATYCPKCLQQGQKIIKSRITEPTFSQKIYPMWDPNLGREIHSHSHREKVMKEMGVISKEGHRRTTAKQERYLYQQRLHLKPPR